jgi:soluble lytic murein transglycosylase-like protein
VAYTPIQQSIYDQAVTSGVDPNLALAIAQQESNFNQSALSSTGAIGVFQLEPSTAAEMGLNPYDLNSNIYGGISYIKQLLDQFGGNQDQALAAYNWGPGNVSSGQTIPQSVQDYVQGVNQKAAAFGQSPVSSTNQTSSSSGYGLFGWFTSDVGRWVAIALGLILIAAGLLLFKPVQETAIKITKDAVAA